MNTHRLGEPCRVEWGRNECHDEATYLLSEPAHDEVSRVQVSWTLAGRREVFLEFPSEKHSGTDGAASGGERVGPSSIDKVPYAFSAMFFGHGFKKVALKDGLHGTAPFYS